MSQKNNTLSMPEFYKVTRWIDENKEAVFNQTQAQVAEAATTATGIKVTVSNIRAVADTLGIHLGHNISTSRHPTNAMQILAKRLCELYIRMDELVPADIKYLSEKAT